MDAAVALQLDVLAFEVDVAGDTEHDASLVDRQFEVLARADRR
ncbi:hypothetical protein [Acidovorax sp. GBBC 3334]|nr:hypothetical protein [Acidovorax sp. GBBC 3334]